MKVTFHEFSVDDLPAADLCSDIVTSALSPTKPLSWLACINPHSYITARYDNEFYEALLASTWLVSDGVGVNLFSRLGGKSVKHRVTGWDVFMGVNKLLEQCPGASVFFLGSTEATLEGISSFMGTHFPRLKVSGTYSPPFKEEFDDNDIEAMLSVINSTQPTFLWVGLTAPKQEKWFFANQGRLNVGAGAAVGAVFDFCAGTTPRAPLWMRSLGLEWVHRSLSSPQRLGVRNLKSNPMFVLIMLYRFVRGNKS